jgi:predicted metal-dependent hydrolase
MSQRDVKDMLQKHTPWVLKHLQDIPQQPIHALILPQKIHFSAIHQTWVIKYEEGAGRLCLVEAYPTLTLRGKYEADHILQEALKRWVKKQAKLHLSVWLAKTAADMNLTYHAVSIRLQKRRWGSCSAKGNISLNAALLFLPDFLVQHVLIHELAHLKHLNHSKAFWSEVEKFEPEYKENRRLLKQQAKDVPAWLTEQL